MSRCARSFFHKAVACMAVIVDAVLLLKLLNVPQLSLGMRAGYTIAERLVRMQKYFLQTACKTHAFVLSQIMQQGGKALLQPQCHVNTLNLQWRADVEQGMAK